MNCLEHPDSAETAAQALIDFGPDAVPAILETLRTAEEDEIIALLLRVLNVDRRHARPARTSCRCSITRIR